LTALSVVASFAIFAAIRFFANPPPHTMTKEWQEASNEILKVRCPAPLHPYMVARLCNPLIMSGQAQNSDPITGIASEGYTGKGVVQSPPAKG